MNWLVIVGEILVAVVVGVASSALTIWANDKLTTWRLRAVEKRVEKTEEDITDLQQRTSRLEA